MTLRLGRQVSVSVSSSKHKTYITLVKDSLEELLDGPVDNWEPKPKNKGRLFNTKDDFYQNI